MVPRITLSVRDFTTTKVAFIFAQTMKFSISAAKAQNKSFKERSNLKSVISCIYFHFFLNLCEQSLGESSHTFLKNKQTNYFYQEKTKQKYPLKWFVTRMMFTIHQKRFSFLKKKKSFFYKWNEPSRGDRPGVNRPFRKMVLERIVPEGTVFERTVP